MRVSETTRAVLFDMTGTLHPQRDLAAAAAAAADSALAGWTGDPDHARSVIGSAMRERFAEIVAQPFYLIRDLNREGWRRGLERLGVDADQAMLDDMLTVFESTLVAGIRPYDEAHDVLQTIRGHGIRTAIVSVNDHRLLDDCVAACGFGDLFDVVLSSEEAQSCKPHPAIFELALDRLGVSAGDAVFVGDMPAIDVLGANRLGMRTVLTTEDNVFLGHIESDDTDAVPDHVIATLAELPAVLGL